MSSGKAKSEGRPEAFACHHKAFIFLVDQPFHTLKVQPQRFVLNSWFDKLAWDEFLSHEISIIARHTGVIDRRDRVACISRHDLPQELRRYRQLE